MAPETPTRNPETVGETLLVVDDEISLVDLLTDAFSFAGYRVLSATSGSAALAAVADHSPDLVLLDVNLPDLDGFEVCRRLRDSGSTVPVVFLTARDGREDLRAGFGTGGDDYVNKPFSLEELRLRIAAVLRRSSGQPTAQRPLSCAGLTLDPMTHAADVAGRRIDLSPTEFRLLCYLVAHQGSVLTRAQILDEVWQYDFGGDSQVVATYISYLRRKLMGHPSAPVINTVRGIGYMLQEPTPL